MGKEDKNLKVINVSNKVAAQIIEEEDFSKLPELIKLFKASIAKKEVLRVVKLTELLDTIEDKVKDRFEKTELITNSELLDYMKVTQSSIDRANKMLSDVDGTSIPVVSAGNTVNIVNFDSGDKVSKDKIAKAVLAILNKAKESQVIDAEEVEEVSTIIEEIEGED